MSIIELKGVGKSYGNVAVISDINISIEKGSIVGIIGPSGSGKTTILQLMIGYLQPSSGIITIQPGLKVGITTQNNCLYEKLTVLENMHYFGEIAEVNCTLDRIEGILRYVGLFDARERLAENLSGGMLRRLDLAVCLLQDPQVIILDELTAGLDPVAREDFGRKVADLKRMGKTIIMSTHLLDEVEELCDYLYIISNGKIAKVCKGKEEMKLENDSDEIVIKTSPGKYDNLIRELQNYYSSPIDHKIKGASLVICTKKSHESIYHLLHAIHKSHERLIEIDIQKPDINDFFNEIVKKDLNKKAESKHTSNVGGKR